MSKISEMLDNASGRTSGHRSTMIREMLKQNPDVLLKNPLLAAYPEIKTDILRKLKQSELAEKLETADTNVTIDRGLEKSEQKSEPVNMVDHPPQYQFDDPAYEPIKVINAWKMDFNIGNAIKYLARYKKKWNPVEDLKKAIFYIQDEINRLEAEGRNN